MPSLRRAEFPRAVPGDPRRLHEVLTGVDTSQDFAALSAADRTSILEILRDTKPELAAGVAN